MCVIPMRRSRSRFKAPASLPRNRLGRISVMSSRLGEELRREDCRAAVDIVVLRHGVKRLIGAVYRRLSEKMVLNDERWSRYVHPDSFGNGNEMVDSQGLTAIVRLMRTWHGETLGLLAQRRNRMGPSLSKSEICNGRGIGSHARFMTSPISTP
ncbi:hypothetical protein DFH09DRAFT_1158177 [Mycena vulgaris]|nr:hypothetical protein DFH09DRAFT_1158177 [Mycena vulgaris]